MSIGWAHISGTYAEGEAGSVQYKLGDTQHITGSSKFVFDPTTGLVVTGNVAISGTLSANEYRVNVVDETVTNIYSEGSSKFGNSTDDQHLFTGSLVITGAADSAIVYQVTSSVYASLIDPDHTNHVDDPGPGPASYFYLTSSNSVHRGILNYSYETSPGSGVSASVADTAAFVRSINPALVVSGASIFNDPVSIQGGLFGASPIDIYAPLVFQRDDLTEASPDDIMKIEQGKFVGNVIISSSNDNHGLWMEGAGYIVMNSKKTLSEAERAPEFVQNNRTSDNNSYPMIAQRVFQGVDVSKNPLFLYRKHNNARHHVGEQRWSTEFPVLTGSDSSSAAHYQRFDFDVARIVVQTDPRRNSTAWALQTFDINMDPEYEALDAVSSADRNISGSMVPIISSSHFSSSKQNYSSSLSNVFSAGGFGNPGAGNRYGLKRGIQVFGNLNPAGWAFAEEAGFASNFVAKDCTIGHPVARWGDFYIHDDRYIRWGQVAGDNADDAYKRFYNSNPLTQSARIDSGSVIFGYNSSSAFLEVSGATVYLNDGLNVTGSGYVNFGTTKGTSGYGVRDNAGTLEFKDSGGSWTEFGTGGSTIGEPEDGDYTDGLFTDITGTMAVGTPIDRFNEVLKILAPSPAPALSRINYGDVPNGVSVKLSFDSTNTITGYTASATAAGFSAVTRNNAYAANTSGNNFRLGVYNGSQEITGTLNFTTGPSVTNGNLAYASGAFGNAETGSLNLELNGTIIHTVVLTGAVGAGNPATGSATSYTNGSGFTHLSVTASSIDGNGADWYIFKHRTAKYKIEANDQKVGWNYLRVIHTIASTNNATNYIEWINDPDGPLANLSASLPRIDEVSLTGTKYVSGVKYNTDLTAKYKVDLINMYKNVYPSTDDTITFNETNCDNITAQSVGAISTNENQVVKVTASVNNNQNLLLNGTIGVSVNATHPLKTNLSTTGSATITGMLIDNDSSGPNSNLVETFIDEDFRIKSASYGSQPDLTGSAWNSQTIMTGSNVDGHQDGLLFYDRRLSSPRSVDESSYQLPASGNFSSLANVSAGNPNYSAVGGFRTLYRKIQNTSSSPVYDMKITMEKHIAAIRSNGPDANDIDLYVKIPGQTGWMNSWGNFVFGSVSDGNGALINGATDNSNHPSQAAVTASHCLTFGTASVATGDYLVAKVVAASNWRGYLANLQFQLGASDVSAPTEAFVLDDIDLDDTDGETAKLSFGTSNVLGGYTSVAGGKGSMGSVNSNAVYTDNSDNNRGVFKALEIMGGTLNEDINSSGDNYSAKSFKNAHTGSLLLIVNDATSSTLDLSNLTAHNNLSSNTGFTVGVVDYSTTTDGIPDYIKSYRTGTYSIGTGAQRSGWNYARVLHRIGAADTLTNYVQWVVDPSGSSDDTSITGTALSDFGHTNIYHQSGIGYFAANPTGSYTCLGSNFYKNVYQNGTAISFPTVTGCTVSNIKVIGTGITTFNSAVSSTSMPALNNNANCESTTIELTGTITYNSSSTSLSGGLGLFDPPASITTRAQINHPLKSNRQGSSVTKNYFLRHSGTIGSTNLNTLEHFGLETYRIVSGNYALQSDATGSSNAWNSSTHMNGGGTHDDGMVTINGYLISPKQIGNAGDTRNTTFQAPVGNPNYSSLTNATRTYYRYFKNNSGGSSTSIDITLHGSGSLVKKSLNLADSTGYFYIEAKIPGTTAWLDVGKSLGSANPLVDGSGAGTGFAAGNPPKVIATGGTTIGCNFNGLGLASNNNLVLKISAHKDWVGYINRITIGY
jgi:hypothetical protein